MQGGHQVAQKLTTRILPPKSLVEIFRPVSVVTEKLGGGIAGDDEALS